MGQAKQRGSFAKTQQKSQCITSHPIRFTNSRAFRRSFSYASRQ